MPRASAPLPSSSSPAPTPARCAPACRPASRPITAGGAAPPCTQRVRVGSDIPLIPRHRLNLGVDHHLTPWLTLWVSGAWVGPQRLRGDEENVEPTLPSYFTMSAGARARWKG